MTGRVGFLLHADKMGGDEAPGGSTSYIHKLTQLDGEALEDRGFKAENEERWSTGLWRRRARALEDMTAHGTLNSSCSLRPRWHDVRTGR